VIASLEWPALLLLGNGPYVHPVKLGALAVAFALWALLAQWVDKDTVAVNTYRVLWNLIVLGSGSAALGLALFVPAFWIGFPLFLVLNASVILAYVLHRNRLVKEEDRVLTAGHFRRLKEEGFRGKKKLKVVTERVRLTGADRRVVAIPAEEAEREQYRLTQDLMFNALWRRAGVVEVVPAGPQLARVIYVVDGMPVEGENLPRPDADALVGYVKQMAGLNLEERRKPQKGEIMAAIGDHKHKAQVRTDGSTAGEKLTIRIIYREASYKVPDLGFTPRQLELVQAAKEEPRGLVLLSAPAGCGLTTSIYSFARTHDRFLQNVQTIEYEKELDVDNVTQTVFVPTEASSFAERLLRLVRTDPDIIVLPELREREAAAVASKAASEKQKVYVGLMAGDVFEALRKWVAMVGDKVLVAKSLLAVSNQRLVRTLCPECKQAYKPDPQMMRKLNLPDDKVLYRPPEPQFDKRGNPIICQACQGSGYTGRTGVFDWLAVDDGLRDVIRRSASMTDIQNYAQKKGGVGLQAYAMQKVLDGLTSIQELARVLRAESAASRAGPSSAGPRPRPEPRGERSGQTPGGR
jgi:type II secretory ATPase GspE/PulE/Tfp pilus assembly ATPase PilB-like protein